MKIYVIIILLFTFFFGCKANDNLVKPNKLKYVYKTTADCKSPVSYSGDTIGYRVYLKYPKVLPDGIIPDKIRSNKCNYFWNLVFYYYSVEEQIEILNELLSFENDTDLAGIKVCKYKSFEIEKPKSVGYTMQTDALYLFTNLVMGGYTPDYCPYPILIDTETGEEINNNEKIKEVFGIYREWLDAYKKNGTKNLRVPLYGSKYQWYGSTVNLEGKNKYETDFNEVFLKQINQFPNLPVLDTMYF